MTAADFDYSFDGLFVCVYANNAQAAANLSACMLMNDGSNKFLPVDFETFRRAARNGGYSVRKIAKFAIASDDELLAELQA